MLGERMQRRIDAFLDKAGTDMPAICLVCG
jgi:hypothetical protein